MARKTYVVFVGRLPGVYESWVECQEQVNGFHGCSYSSFPTREEAERAWEEWTNRGGDHKGINPVAVMGGSGLNVRQKATGPEDVTHGTCLTLLCCVAVTLLSIYYYYLLRLSELSIKGGHRLLFAGGRKYRL
ncbi:Ribosomal protein L9/RNase H1, N-terminal [Sesbania bispinosa]|nr:Ribosomal protein L9/RNase H1, N-terminal [Sesbania bispinosa]